MNYSLHEGVGLATCVLTCFAAAGVNSLFTTPQIDTWYAALRKPAWTPPNWLFGPVWLALYLSMAVAAWLVWRQHGFSGAALPLALFALQLTLNIIWSALFFGLKNPGAAFIDILLLWLAIAATLILFWPLSSVAGWLLVPYLIWVTYAAALNLAIWRLNSWPAQAASSPSV